MPLQAWYHFGRNGCLRSWDRTSPPPWKAKRSVLRDVPGADDPSRITPDLAHIGAIGTGKEYVASTIILFATRIKLWPGRAVGTRLEQAYRQFREWCTEHKQTCKISDFQLRTFKIQKLPACYLCSLQFFVFGIPSKPTHCTAQVEAVPHTPRTGPRLHRGPQVVVRPLRWCFHG